MGWGGVARSGVARSGDAGWTELRGVYRKRSVDEMWMGAHLWLLDDHGWAGAPLGDGGGRAAQEGPDKVVAALRTEDDKIELVKARQCGDLFSWVPWDN